MLSKKYLSALVILFVVAAYGAVIDNLKISGNTISSLNTDGDIVLDPNGSGGVLFNDLTASIVPYLDANKEIATSSVTDTERGY